MGFTDGRPGTSARCSARLIGIVLASFGCIVFPSWRAEASCKAPLPDPSLHALDLLAEGDSEAAVKEARQSLAELPAGDWATAAQLQAIIADASDTLDDDVEALDAVAAGRAALASLGDTGGRMDSVALRLQLVEADTAHGSAELEAALAALTEAEPKVAVESVGHACLLLVRGRVEGGLGRPDTAASDGIASYRMARRLNEPDASAEAAYQLSVTYRRAGIYDSSLELADEVVGYTR